MSIFFLIECSKFNEYRNSLFQTVNSSSTNIFFLINSDNCVHFVDFLTHLLISQVIEIKLKYSSCFCRLQLSAMTRLLNTLDIPILLVQLVEMPPWSHKKNGNLFLNVPITTKVICFSRLLKCLRSLYGKQCGPRSNCSYRSSLFWVQALCFHT